MSFYGRKVVRLLLLVLVLGLSGCPKKQPREPGEPEPAPSQKEDPAVADIPLDPSAIEDHSRRPSPPAKPPERIAAHYIVIKYQGDKQSSGVERNKAQAGKRARRLVLLARQKGVDFVDLARKYSEVPREERGQQLIFSRGEMTPAFDKAAFGLGLGQVSDAVDTPFGYYVMMRVLPEEYSSAHILIQYKGAKQAPPASRWTREEASKKANAVHAKVIKPGANFAVLAEQYSESPSKKRGGVIRPIAPGTMPAAYDNYVAALLKLKVGQVSPVVETPFGFHIIKRLKLERIAASHILIAFNDAAVDPREPRRRGEAMRLARKVRNEAQAEGADFAALAKKHSDDLESAEKGGDQGTFARGMKVPRFEQIAFGLKVGEVSDVVETRFGFHIIKRTK